MSAWRSGGIGPEKAGAGLRGIGFIAIAIAFLAVSSTYLSDDDDKPAASSTTPAGPRVVLVAESLRGAIEAAAPGATYRFAASGVQRAAIESGAAADVFITDVAADADALRKADRCSEAVTIATKAAAPVRACVVVREGANEAASVAYVQRFAGLEARAALLEAGYDVPER